MFSVSGLRGSKVNPAIAVIALNTVLSFQRSIVKTIPSLKRIQQALTIGFQAVQIDIFAGLCEVKRNGCAWDRRTVIWAVSTQFRYTMPWRAADQL